MAEARLLRKKLLEWEESPQNPRVMLSPIVRDRICSKLTSYVVTVPSGSQVKPHVHDGGITDISFIVRGEGVALINGEWVSVESGDYYVVPPQVEHGVRNTGEGEMEIMALLVTS